MNPDQLGNERSSVAPTDPTGRDRLVWNVLASWGAYGVFVVAGFILPRIIDRQLGQVALGVWDFGWSLVSYFGIAQLGIGSSVNRYVAKYRAENRNTELNGAVSTVMVIQVGAAIAALAAAVVAGWLIPPLLGSRLGELTGDAQWLVLLLGSAIAAQVAFDSFRGVMTGCHRWDLHNAINAGFYGLSVTAMIAALSLSMGLRTLAGIYLVGVVVTEIVRARFAFRICPELRLRWRYANVRQAREMFRFGGKTIINVLSYLLLYQGTNVIITAHLGAAALALFARPMALIRHVGTFIQKFAFVLTPTVSSMDAATGQHEKLRELFLKSVRYSAHLALPLVLFLALLGDAVLHVWMGPHYAQGNVMAVLALGHLMGITHAPMVHILIGLDKHGRVALAFFSAAVLGAGLVVTALVVFDTGLLGAAIAMTLSLTIGPGIYIPLYACRQLGFPMAQYLVGVWGRPVLCVAPFATCLVAARLLFADRPWMQLAFTGIVGGPVLGVTYYTWVVPAHVRKQGGRMARKIFGGVSRRARRTQE